MEVLIYLDDIILQIYHAHTVTLLFTGFINWNWEATAARKIWLKKVWLKNLGNLDTAPWLKIWFLAYLVVAWLLIIRPIEHLLIAIDLLLINLISNTFPQLLPFFVYIWKFFLLFNDFNCTQFTFKPLYLVFKSGAFGSQYLFTFAGLFNLRRVVLDNFKLLVYVACLAAEARLLEVLFMFEVADLVPEFEILFVNMQYLWLHIFHAFLVFDLLITFIFKILYVLLYLIV